MNHQRKVAVIGLGYVGLSTALGLSHAGKVIAYDLNVNRITELKEGYDRNEEVNLNKANIYFTANPEDLNESDFYIITVPTPIDKKTKQPDLSMILNATETIGKYLKKGDIVVYESTLYPGATKEEFIPLLEKISKLVCGKDFSVGYSPERINPADKVHIFENIVKIISATDKKTLDIMASVYKSVIKAGVFPVSSISVAEATKVMENTQRDINIAIMNDLAILSHLFGIETAEVISAMKTKWNFIDFQPGLVGGHCIGVNSYYLMYRAEEFGYHSDIIMAGRRINESISKFIVKETIKKLINLGIIVNNARVAILGITYKQNCPDLRDSRVIDIINELKSYKIETLVHDPIADEEAAKKEYQIILNNWDNLNDLDALIVAVAHDQYKEMDRKKFIEKLNSPGLIVDINEIFHPEEFAGTGIELWRL